MQKALKGTRNCHWSFYRCPVRLILWYKQALSGKGKTEVSPADQLHE